MNNGGYIDTLQASARSEAATKERANKKKRRNGKWKRTKGSSGKKRKLKTSTERGSEKLEQQAYETHREGCG